MVKKNLTADITGITVVLPIHELATDNDTKLFKGAITSVTDQTVKPDEILIVVPTGSDIEKTLKDFDFGEAKDMVRIISNPNGSDFQTQINYGIENGLVF